MNSLNELSQYAKQPQWKHDLIDQISLCFKQGRSTMHVPANRMTAKEQVWLEAVGLDMSFDKRIMEWKIELTNLI